MGTGTLSCDSLNACVAIPVFNHAKTVANVVLGARRHASTVLVFDDGSTDGSGERAKSAGAQLLASSVNRGKGAALRSLFEEAQKRGFAYVFCLDADGQHFPEDLDRLVETARRHPRSLVVGSRDLVAAGAPGSSRFGRRFSNFWVWFEAGIEVEDSQSGFRAYPLPETLTIAGKRSRYDFEVEILIRAGWAGLPVTSVPIRALYPKDRITHFRAFVDNARISLLNTVSCLRLLLPIPLGRALQQRPRTLGLSLYELRRWAWLGGTGPLWRGLVALVGALALTFDPRVGLTLPLALGGSALLGLGLLPACLAIVGAGVLARSSGLSGLPLVALCAGVGALWGWLEVRLSHKPQEASSWSGRSRGGLIGHWIFLQLARLFGRRACELMLYPVVFYYTLAARGPRRASGEFLDRAMGPARGLTRFLRTYRHIFAFARTLVDKALLATRGKSALTVLRRGQEHISDAHAAGKGALLLTAHIGNWEIAGAFLEEKRPLSVAVVAFSAEEEGLSKLWAGASKGPKPKTIAVNDTELAGLEILRELREGTLVALQGDRAVDNRVVQLPFFGRPAPFPMGPFVLAAVSGSPLIWTFSVQVGPGTYQFTADAPRSYAFDRKRPRDEQVSEWVRPYIARLEELLRDHPLQWFNFYDFWTARPPGARSTR